MEFGCLGAFLVAVVAIAVAIALNARMRTARLENDLQALRAAMGEMVRDVRLLRERVARGAGEATSAPKAEEARPAARAEEARPVATAAAMPPPMTMPVAPVAQPPLAPPPVTPHIEPPPSPLLAKEPIPQPFTSDRQLDNRQPATREPATSEPQPAVRHPQPASRPLRSIDWEAIIGVKLFSWVAAVAIVLAAVFALKYSVEHGWIGPAIRATIGLATGALFIAVCELRVASGYRTTANAMHGAGIAILYATLFAMHALWHLAPAVAVFAAMLVVTALAVYLSVRRDSIFIALLGMLGGFATPALLASGANRPIALFSYLLLLNAGLAWVALQKRWPLLTACSIAFTLLYQWAWVGNYLGASQLPLAATIFGVFALGAATTLWLRRGREADVRARSWFDRTAIAGAVLPLLFAMFTAAVPAYGARFNVLFTFLLFITAGLALIAALHGPSWLHLLGAISSIAGFAIWFARSYTSQAWPAIVFWVAGFVVLFVGGDALARKLGRPYAREGSFAATASTLLLFAFPLLAYVEPHAAAPQLLFGVLLALLAMIGAFAIACDRGGAYYIAAFFAIAAEGVWSAKWLTPDRLTTALALYVVFAFFFIGVPLAAKRFGRALTPESGNSLVVFASLALSFFLANGGVAEDALFALAVLLAVLNVGAFLLARDSRQRIFVIAGAIVSWIAFAVWWSGADVALPIVPALAVLAGFALLVAGGSVMMRRTNDDASSYVALAVYFFLADVAATHAYAVHATAFLATLAVLAVAFVAAALLLNRGSLAIASLAASQLVLLGWTSTIGPAYGATAVVAALATGALGFAAIAIARRSGRNVVRFAAATAVALYLGQFIASDRTFALHIAAGVPLLIGILAVAWIVRDHRYDIIAVATSAITISAATLTMPQQLAIAAAAYGCFLAYPLLLGRRAERSLLPYLAAVLASIPFFFFAYDALVAMGYKPFIGLLPVVQAALLLLLLLRLLRLEAPGARELTRLAVVAGAALAFVTLAIPLQLDNEWITVGWALEAAALIWLFTKIPHRGLLAWSGGLFAVVFVRLVFNPAVFSYHASSSLKIVNWYLYTYLVVAAAFFAGAMLLPRAERERTRAAVPALVSCGTLLLFFLLNIEIADFYSTGPTLTFNFFSSSLAQDLTYTIGWATFAMGMLVAGIALHARGARVAAIVLLAVTILKCFLHDLGRFGGLYRVASLVGLAAALLVVGILLQRFVMRAASEQPSS